MGTVLSRRYLIERPIGTGGTSTVFSALDRRRMYGPSADAMVAVKVLLPPYRNDQTRIDRLIREFRYMQRLTHPRIARVFDLDCDEGVWFMTLELLQGESLNRYLRRHADEGLSTDDAMRILVECSEALLCAHEHGVVHGDLKPGNVFIDARGGAHLLDFGSVPEPDANVGTVHEQFLTPAYASPQMLEGQPAEARDDLYSLGCLAYEIFSGRHPFDQKSSIEARAEKLRLIWVPSIPARHFGVIARMLSWDRDERPTSAQEFIDSLHAAQSKARAAYVRQPKAQVTPEAPAPEESAPTVGSAPAQETPAEQKSTRESRRHATPEDLARAFAQFAGVVPDDWVSLDDPVAPADAPSRADDLTTADTDQPRARWAKAIPPELIEPKARAHALPVSGHATSEAGATAAASVESIEPVEPDPLPRKRSWRERLGNMRIHPRAHERLEPVIAATESTEVDATPTVPVHASPIRQASKSNWMAKWRQWRPGLATRPPPASTHPAHAFAVPEPWTPAVSWQRDIQVRWPDIQLAVSVAPTPIVQFDPGLLPEPRVLAPTDVPPPAAPATLDAGVAQPTRWRRALQRLPKTKQSRTQQSRARHSWAEQRSQWRTTVARGVAGTAIHMRTATRHLAKSGASLSNATAALLHWQNLRRWIASVSGEHGPQWREAMPVIAIAGLAVVALLVLQLSYQLRPLIPATAGLDSAAQERLAALANAEVALTMPQIADLRAPLLPMEPAAPAIPAAPGLISFQSKRVYIAPGQQMAAINVLRQRSTAGAAPVSWSIAPGTAKPDVDYELPPSQRARFYDGQDVRTVFIPIKRSSSTRERRFTIRLRKTPGAPAFGQITETEVIIGGNSVESVASVN